MIGVSYRAPEEVNASISNTDNNASKIVANSSSIGGQPSVDDIVATGIASNVASITNMPIAGDVAELAVSTHILGNLVQANDGVAIKPQIINLSAATRNIIQYQVKRGDTLASIASKFNISKDTIKWANDMDSDEVIVSTTLDILPINGIVYVVRQGDTAASIASRYKATAASIISYNDLELSGIKSGLKIIVPNGVLPTNERPGYVSYSSFVTGYSVGNYGAKVWFIRVGTPNYGGYAAGNCTAYAFDKRQSLGRPIGRMWGNAGTWATAAMSAGYKVNNTPAPGAIIQDSTHVAIVEKVLPNGDLELSEMNYGAFGPTIPGNNVVSGRILPAAYVKQYLYIH